MKTIEVAAAIIKQGNTILATQRGYGDFEGGWEFPGGKIEPGETPACAAVREIDEELDVDIAIDRLVFTVEHDYPTFHLTMHCFESHIVAGSIKLREHRAARWLSREELDEVEWLEADIELIEAIKARGIV